MNDDKLESPLNVPTNGACASNSSREEQIDEQERRFTDAVGRKYIFDANDDASSLDDSPKDPRLASLPSPPRDVSFLARMLFFTCSTPSSANLWLALCWIGFVPSLFIALSGTFVSFYERQVVWENFAEATVVESRQADVSSNDYKPTILFFEGVAPDGSKFSGRSYSSRALDAGAKVGVEKARGTTDVLRVKGGTLAAFETSTNLALSISLLFACFAAYVILRPIFTGRRFLKLLTFGEPTLGVFAGVRDSGKRAGFTRRPRPGLPIMIVTFRFRANDGKVYATEVPTTFAEDLTNTKTKVLFYDPENPKNAFVLDAAPYGIRLREGRGFDARFLSAAIPMTLVFLFLIELVAAFYCGSRVERATFDKSQPAAVESLETQK